MRIFKAIGSIIGECLAIAAVFSALVFLVGNPTRDLGKLFAEVFLFALLISSIAIPVLHRIHPYLRDRGAL